MSEYWVQMDHLIDQALALEPGERVLFIKEQCGSNKKLLQETLDYLSFIEKAEEDSFLEPNSIHSDTFSSEVLSQLSHADSLEQIKGKQIGPYVIKSLLGEGGMGVVYLAEREDGQFEQKVAIKFLKGGFYSLYLLERFEQEKIILSRLEHPNITRLLDGGITDDNSPYLIMEFVEGVPIQQFCRENNLKLKARIDLFLQICDAVQHAHSKLIVHRDLKPDNILVTPKGKTKVTDFGIGKLLTSEKDLQHANVTKEGQFLGSLNYSAPEQFEKNETTVKTDIYGLGLLLYLLITDEKAFDFEGDSLEVARRTILQQQPTRPSLLQKTAVGTISKDLEAIVLKALRKDPSERYNSVIHLQADLENYLFKRPVLARKGTFQYRTKKFVQRNSLRIGITVLLIGLMLGGISYHLRTLTVEHNLAREEAEKVTLIKNLMIDIFSANNPRAISFAGKDLTVSQAMVLGLEHVTENVDQNPEVYTELSTAIGNTLTNIEDYENAYTAYMFSLNQTAAHKGTSSIEYSSMLATVASFMRSADSLDRAVEFIEESIEVVNSAENATEMDIANRYGIYGFILGRKGEFEQAKITLEMADSLYVAGNYAETLPRHRSLANLADLYTRLRNYEEAESALTTSTQYFESVYDSLHVDIVTNITKLGTLYSNMGENRLAEEYLLRGLDLRSQIYGQNSSYTAQSHSSLFINYRILGELDKALYHASKQIEISEIIYGDQSLNYSQALNNYALALQENGNLEEAEEYFATSLQIKEDNLPGNSAYLGVGYYNMANLYYLTGRYSESLTLFERVLEIDTSIFGENHAEIAIDLSKVAMVQRDMGNFEAAGGTFQKAGEIFSQSYPENHYRVAEYHMELGKMYYMQNIKSSALDNLNRALDIFLNNFDETHKSVQSTQEYIELTHQL